MASRGWENATDHDVRDRRQAPDAVKAVARLTTLEPAKTPLRRRQKGPDDWANVLQQQLYALKLPPGERDYRFDEVRKWLMDLAWPWLKTFAECDGGEWSVGRHSRAPGMQSDCEKWNAATLAGWRGFRFVGSQVKSGYAAGILELVLKG